MSEDETVKLAQLKATLKDKLTPGDSNIWGIEVSKVYSLLMKNPSGFN